MKYPAITAVAAWTIPIWLGAWLKAFVVTQVFEVAIYATAMSWAWRDHVPRVGSSSSFVDGGPHDPIAPSASRHATAWACALLPSSVTHPVVWFAFPLALPDDWYTMVAVAETFAVVVETLMLWLMAPRLGVAGALVTAASANMTSLGLGLWLRTSTGWV